MDIEVSPANGVPGPLITRLYDKRREPQFAQLVTVMRFPAADSMLAWSCKLNVFDSQFVRFARIISDTHNLKTEIIRLLSEMIAARYPHADLMRRCRRRCEITPVLLGAARGTEAPRFGRVPSGFYPQIRVAMIGTFPQIIWHAQ